MNAQLNNHHRDTLQKIFARPSSRNVEWRAVRSLLEAVGTVQERHDGKLKVTVGPETEVLSAPKHKDIDVQMLVDLRRMLAGGGFSPTGRAQRDERVRDHGDGRWAEPT